MYEYSLHRKPLFSVYLQRLVELLVAGLRLEQVVEREKIFVKKLMVRR